MTAYIALGSNLGDRLAHLRSALEGLREIGTIVACSSIYETEPREYTEQPWFLNAVVAMETTRSPQLLLRSLLAIESALGRERHSDAPAKGPRVIDLDLLFYGNEVVQSPGLNLPHPRFHERLFVLAPMNEIAPELVHPTLKRTIHDLFEEVSRAPSAGIVRLFLPPLVPPLC